MIFRVNVCRACNGLYIIWYDHSLVFYLYQRLWLRYLRGRKKIWCYHFIYYKAKASIIMPKDQTNRERQVGRANNDKITNSQNTKISKHKRLPSHRRYTHHVILIVKLYWLIHNPLDFTGQKMLMSDLAGLQEVQWEADTEYGCICFHLVLVSERHRHRFKASSLDG